MLVVVGNKIFTPGVTRSRDLPVGSWGGVIFTAGRVVRFYFTFG